MIVALVLAASLQAQSDARQIYDQAWQTKIFRHVQVAPQGPKLTIKVAWHGIDTFTVKSSGTTDAAIVILKDGHVISKTPFLGFLSWQEAHVFTFHGYTLLDVASAQNKTDFKEVIYRFDETGKPIALLASEGFDLSPLPDGYIVETMDAARLAAKERPSSRASGTLGRRITFQMSPWRVIAGKWGAEPALGPKIALLGGKKNGHTFRLRIEQELPPISKFKVAGGGVKFEGRWLWNYGYFEDSMSPAKVRDELRQLGIVIKSYGVLIDGKSIVVPRGLYRDLWWPHLDSVKTSLARDGKRLTVVLEGADGMGSWTATWTIRSNGKVTRKMASNA